MSDNEQDDLNLDGSSEDELVALPVIEPEDDEWNSDESSQDEMLDHMEVEGDLEPNETIESVISRHSLTLKNVHSQPFRKFSVHWSRDCHKYGKQLMSEITSGARKRYRLGPIVQAGHGQAFANNLKLVIEQFVAEAVVPKFLKEEDDEEFLNLFWAFWSYTKSVRNWLRSSFIDIHSITVPGETEIKFLDYCQLALIKPVYSSIKHRLQKALLNTLKKLRSMYPCCSPEVRTMFEDEILDEILGFVTKCVDEDHKDELKTLWWDPLVQQLFEQFSDALDFENTRFGEREYLNFVGGIMVTEMVLFDVLSISDSDAFEEFEMDFRDKLCEEYKKWKEQGSFYRTLDHLSHEDMMFDRDMFETLVDLHLKSRSHGERFLENLKSEVKEKKIGILNTDGQGTDELSEWPPKGIMPYMIRLDQYKDVISRRLHGFMEDYAGLLTIAEECSANLHTDLEAKADSICGKVAETQNKIAAFLCSGYTTRDDFIRERKALELFFKYLADQSSLLRELERFVVGAIESQRFERIRVIAAFIKLEGVQPSVSQAFSEIFEKYNVLPIDESI